MHNPFQELAERLSRIDASLTELRQRADQSPASVIEEPIDVGQAAALLRLSKQTIYDRVNAGSLPHVKQGHRLYFFKSELIAQLKASRGSTEQALAESAQAVVGQAVAKRRRRPSSES